MPNKMMSLKESTSCPKCEMHRQSRRNIEKMYDQEMGDHFMTAIKLAEANKALEDAQEGQIDVVTCRLCNNGAHRRADYAERMAWLALAALVNSCTCDDFDITTGHDCPACKAHNEITKMMKYFNDMVV